MDRINILRTDTMQSSLTKEQKDKFLKIASNFYSVFGEPGELRGVLWPLIIAAVGSKYFEELDLPEKEKVLIAYDEVLKFTEAACHLLQEDIKNYCH